MSQEKLDDFNEVMKEQQISEEYGPGNERWEFEPLSDFIEPVLGKTPKRSEEEYWGGDIKWAAAKDISQSKTRRIFDTEDRMTEAGKAQCNAKILPEGTVVVVARGSMGKVAQLGEPMTFNQTCYGLVTNDKLLDDYLYYAWQYVFGQVQAVSYGTIFDTITMKSFDDIEIPTPPLETQREIADILTTFDDQIENNVHLISTINKTAETIYDGLFNNFLEHDEFKQAEIGKIPESYNVAKVGDLLTLEYGEGLPARERTGDEYPVYGCNGITGRHEESLIDGPGVIVGRKGVNFGTVKLEYNDFWPIDTTFYVNPNDESELLYLYHLLKDMPFQHLGSDSAVPGLNRNVAHDQKVALPPIHERNDFVDKVEPMHRILNVLEEENRALDELRNTVMPYLISGAITP